MPFDNKIKLMYNDVIEVKRSKKGYEMKVKFEEIKHDIVGRFVIGSSFSSATADALAYHKLNADDRKSFWLFVGGIDSLHSLCWVEHDSYWNVN